jgi:NTE family protein
MSVALVVGPLLLVVYLAISGPTLHRTVVAGERRRRELAGTVETLRGLDAFAGLTVGACERLAAALLPVPVSAGTTTIHEGDPSDDLYVVRSGEFEVWSSGEAGGPARLVNTMGSDDVFGEIGLLAGSPRTASVRVTADGLVWRIPGEVFLAALADAGPTPDPLRLGMAARLARTHPSRAAAGVVD